MSSENMVICCVPETVYELLCETLRADANSKAFDHELRSDIAQLVDILTNASRIIPGFNFPQEEIPEAMRNNLLTDYYLSLLTGAVTEEKLGWNQEAIVDVKKAAFDALQKHYAIDLPTDDPKSILIRQAANVSSNDEMGRLGFICEGKLRDKGWDVDERIMLWRHPDDISVLTEDFFGKYFTFLGEKSQILVKKLVNSNRLANFMNAGDFVYPQKSKPYMSDFMSVVWKNLDRNDLQAILKEYPHVHVYSLISTESGLQIVPGERGTCIGNILTRHHMFINGGIDIPEE